MFRKLIFSSTLVLALLVTFSQSAFAEESYKIKTFKECGQPSDIFIALREVTTEAEQWMNSVTQTKIINLSPSFTFSCAIITILVIEKK